MMEKLLPVGRWLFALAIIGLGVEHFILNDFITGRAPAWPDGVSGRLAWAYLTGPIFILAGISVVFKRHARFALIVAAALIFVWAFMRQLPVLVSTTLFSGEWTKAGKAITFIGGMLAIASTFPKMNVSRVSPFYKFINLEMPFVRTGCICLGIFLTIAGIQHFMFIEFVASLIPVWFPGDAVFWTKFAGVILIAAGVGLIIPITSKLAALLSGIMVFSWFWIIHIPRTFTSTSDGIAVFEALAVSGIAFVLAAVLTIHQHASAESSVG